MVNNNNNNNNKRPGPDCGSDPQIFTANFRLELNKAAKLLSQPDMT